MKIISPSILNVEPEKIVSSIKEAEKAGAKWIHFDIMDGVFVKAKSFTLEEVEKYLKETSVIKDVHIMISNPKTMVEKYCKLGADILTFHYEACKNDNEVFEVIDLIKNCGTKVGLSIKPNTPADKIFKFLDKVDLVLVMTVEPGEGGQAFIKESLHKIEALKNYKDKLGFYLEVDGGIKLDSAKLCVNAGADVLVSGTYIFKNGNISEKFKELNE